MKFSLAANLACIGVVTVLLCAVSSAQTITDDAGTAASAQLVASNQSAPIQLTLTDAIQRASAMSPALRQAMTIEKIAAEKPTQTRAANLPTVSSNSQYLYTQGNGTPSARYVANNGVHEYIAQVNVHQSLSLANVALYRQSIMASALARDQTEIAQRGLTVTVVQSWLCHAGCGSAEVPGLTAGASSCTGFFKHNQAA